MKRQKTLACLLLCANLALIWGNSLLPGQASGNLSGGVMAFLQKLLAISEENLAFAELLLRKAAHFTEFCSLGLILTWLLLILHRKAPTAPLLAGLLAACVDETIQIYTPGRASSLVDVWIDMAGVACGMMLLNFGYHWIRKKKSKA